MKSQSLFVCEKCGNESLRWAGQCPSCLEWNSMKEVKREATLPASQIGSVPVTGRASKVYKIADIKSKTLARVSTGMTLINKVLGGGLAKGSILLLGGSPGVGKSTLLLGMAKAIKEPVIYFCGEESLEQVKDRAIRIHGGTIGNISFANETNLQNIIATVEQEKPAVAVIDSVQTVTSVTSSASAGSLIQVREAALQLQRTAKSTGIVFILVGHVTKEGDIAGPKILEHIVDGVFYLERESDQIRLLRSAKNRFGSTQEMALLEMSQDGIHEIEHPEAAFLDKQDLGLAGSVVTAVTEGSRVMLVEIQALVVPTVFGYPRRSAVGIHPQRLELILAVLDKRARVNLRNYDVYVKATAGFAAREENADLAIAMALCSAFQNKPIDKKWCIYGEVGLLGEIRQPADSLNRQKAAASLGLKRTIKSKKIEDSLKQVFK